MSPRKIELLSPAHDKTCGMEAIRHGADAIYIGGPKFGARAGAGNTIEDIAALCDYAHIFGAKVYVTLNTILYDNELKEVESIAKGLYAHGVDAFIVQDLAMLRLDLPPIPLHASTQMDNRTPEEAQQLETLGFSQIVLARELSLSEIKRIHKAVNTPLEAFVHGALCVSYSGQCYASEYCFKRSANRGCCAQFCRLPFDLIDGDGHILRRNKHLLSLRDMNRSNALEEMMDAGISSFKIEGRLKGLGYVKNITAFYRKAIDEVLNRRKADYCRSSYGTTDIRFTPQAEKSFNRGFTDYFLHGRRGVWQNFDTPKSMGEPIGEVLSVRNGRIGLQLSGGVTLAPGDGLCYIGKRRNLEGFNVNRVEGSKITPGSMTVLPAVGTSVYRNTDHLFEKMLSRPSADRRLKVSILLQEDTYGYTLKMSDESGLYVSVGFKSQHDKALTPQTANICRQLGKLGDTPFVAENIRLSLPEERFIPSSVMSEWRRTIVEKLIKEHLKDHEEHREKRIPTRTRPEHIRFPEQLDYTANISNAVAQQLCTALGAHSIAPAFEIDPTVPDAVLMTCKYCLRYALGACLKTPGAAAVKGPLFLRAASGKCFPLVFDCDKCEMKVYAPKN